MAYEKQTWATGDTITAQKLNHMEDGIAGAGGVLVVGLQEDGQTLNKTWQEIFNLMKSGTIVFIKTNDDSFWIQLGAVTGCMHMNHYMVQSESTTYVTDSPNGYPKSELT